MYHLQLGVTIKGQKWQDIQFHTHYSCVDLEEIVDIFCQVTHQSEEDKGVFMNIFSKDEHTQGRSIFFANGRHLPSKEMRESGIRVRILKAS